MLRQNVLESVDRCSLGMFCSASYYIFTDPNHLIFDFELNSMKANITREAFGRTLHWAIRRSTKNYVASTLVIMNTCCGNYSAKCIFGHSLAPSYHTTHTNDSQEFRAPKLFSCVC